MLYGMYDTDSPDEEVSLLNIISKVKDSNMTWHFGKPNLIS